MFRKMLVLSTALAGLSCAPAFAFGDDDLFGEAPVERAPGAVEFAQNRDIAVYYDGHGRRVLVDRYTGEILAIQRPRSSDNRRAIRERMRERVRERDLDNDRYYLDDPDDMDRLRRRKLRERGFEDPEYRPVDPRVEDPRYRQVDPEDRAYEENDPQDDEEIAPPPRVRRDRDAELQPPRVRRAPVEQPDADEEQELPAEPGVVERRPLPRVVKPSEEQVVRVPDDNQDELAELEPGTEPGDLAVEPAPEKPAAIDPVAPFGARAEVAALQVLLDRTGVSPGVIDGKFGGNVDKALAAYASVTGKSLKSFDTEGIKAALAAGGDAFVNYTITPEDAAGPYVASVPADYGEKAKLERLSYTSVLEALAERFHMDEGFLKALNPDANFNRPGTVIRVASIGGDVQTEVTRIIADKTKKQVRAYGADGRLVAAYPATIGSEDTPSPTGPHAVARVAFDPDYTYNPKVNFQQGENTKVLTIPPGPNGPVGSIWIALDRPTYGIHGTPEPSKIGKAESHGCVRLTNWDAAELAKLVKPGVVVDFIE